MCVKTLYRVVNDPSGSVTGPVHVGGMPLKSVYV